MEKFFALSNEKQDTIRNAALACFAKHGYEKASINDITVTAGISKASIFQYFGNKQALYQYLFNYCATQMKQAYSTSTLEETTDFFDRVWKASVMKVENLKKHPHIASFIASVVAEPTPKLEGAIFSEANKNYIASLVLHEQDYEKFRHPEDAELVFQMLMMLGKGMSVQLENGTDYDGIMKEFREILNMLKHNFYKEEYLP